MAKLVANSKDFVSRLKAGEVTVAEVRERLYVATLYVLAVAQVLGGLVAKAVVTHGPTLLHYAKKILFTISNAIPDTVQTEPHQQASGRISGVPRVRRQVRRSS
jgi:hypothetical protein